MNRFRKRNAFVFVAVILITVALSYLLDVDSMETQLTPWHMQMNDAGDSLPQQYAQNYRIVDRRRISSLFDSTEFAVYILVDAWGVPHDSSKLKSEMRHFEGIEHSEFLHVRGGDYTKFSEQQELWKVGFGGVYMFGGDSLEYDRKTYIPELGFENVLFCQYCSDSLMLEKLDSILTKMKTLSRIALVLQSSREGDEALLNSSLRQIALLMKKYPKVRFVVQGTHRPILGTREIREQFYAHWVPVVISPKIEKP